MRKIYILQGLLLSLFINIANAQGSNKPKNTLAENKNHPALSSPATKPPVVKKEISTVKTHEPKEVQIKQPQK